MGWGKTRHPLYRRLDGHQGRCGRVRKILPLPGFDPQTVQPVESRNTDYYIPAPWRLNTQTKCFQPKRGSDSGC